MATDILSRTLAVVVVAGFAWLLAHGRLPLVPPGRWTVFAFFAAGMGMCTLAGVRDGIGPESAVPTWLSAAFAGLGLAATATMLAVLVGMSWRLGTVILGALIATNWFLALGYAVAIGSDAVLSGAITLLAAIAVWFSIVRLSISGRPVAGAVS